jgi:hypothetical protein
MANICCSYVHINVADEDSDEHDGDLDRLYQAIDKQDPDLLKACPHLTKNEAYGLVSCGQEEEGEVNLDLSSKWSPPEEDLIELSHRYPALKFVVNYEEPGNSVYGEQEYQDGQKTLDDEMGVVEYLREYHEEFRKECEYVEHLSFKKAVEYILDASELADPRYDDLIESVALARVKDKDLPLLINKEWRTAGDEYKHRLATASI